ncbi:MAG: hypothetical protein AAGI92_02630 [Pseudomonadota bacterium]
MIRLLLRAIAFLFVALASVHGIVDVARSLGSDALLLTSIDETLNVLIPTAYSDFLQSLKNGDFALPFSIPDGTIEFIVSLPTSLVALTIGALFFLLSGFRRRRTGRFTVG